MILQTRIRMMDFSHTLPTQVLPFLIILFADISISVNGVTNMPTGTMCFGRFDALAYSSGGGAKTAASKTGRVTTRKGRGLMQSLQ